jgi:tRNA1(Val) A37 N6-methylase TrmN6
MPSGDKPTMTPIMDDVSDDAVLGGRLSLLQPRRGHRFGHDAILLAAAVDAHAGETAIDLGAGVGAAGLALARRVDGLAVTLVERDPALAALARDNAERNALAARVRAVCLDVAASADAFVAAGVATAAADHVLMNPPFNPPHNPSPDPARRAAHIGATDTLRQWLALAAQVLRPAGTLTLIWRADGLTDVAAALKRNFGATVVLPIHPKPGAAAIRIIVRAEKAAGAWLTTLPGLILATGEGKPSAEAEAVLRHAAAISLAAQ